MRKVFCFFLFFMTPMAFAETIELSDQSVIEAKIIERTDHDITVDRNGVKISYLLDEVLDVDGVPADLTRTIKAYQYPQQAWPGIERELSKFLVNVNFSALKNQARQSRENPQELRAFTVELGGLIRDQGCLDLRHAHPLVRLLVSGLGDGNVLACSAITQLASILLDLLGINSRIIIAPGHVLNCIPLANRQILLADFSNEIFEIVDLDGFYKADGRYLVLKKEQRLPAGQVLEINRQWNRGDTPATLREILNLDLYFYIYVADNISSTAIIYTNLGNDEASKGDFNKALKYYGRALEINPDIAGVYCDRGLAFAGKGNFDRAIADYNKAIGINPNDVNAYNNRGLAFKNKKDFPRAIMDFRQALAIDPNSAQVYDNLGNTYSMEGDYAQGISNYTKALEIDPKDSGAYKNRAALLYLKGR